MAITYIEIDTELLQADINELEANVEKARKSLDSLNAELEELNTMWKGAANTAFRSQTNDDYNIMDNLLQEMSKLADCMTHAKSEYIKCEKEVKSAVSDIRI